MKRIIIALVVLATIYITGCSKRTRIPTVSGTLNGIPAITLYGTSSNISDYILIVISTNAADRLLSYSGPTYSYTTSSGDSVSIIISPTEVIKGYLDTAGTKTVLTVVNPFPPFFTSAQYTSR